MTGVLRRRGAALAAVLVLAASVMADCAPRDKVPDSDGWWSTVVTR